MRRVPVLLLVIVGLAAPTWAQQPHNDVSPEEDNIAEIEQLIETHARAQSLDPELVRAVVTVESSYDPAALSRKGAMGLMQLMPATAAALEVDDPYDPEENLRGGTLYLRRMLDRFGGDLELALAG